MPPRGRDWRPSCGESDSRCYALTIGGLVLAGTVLAVLILVMGNSSSPPSTPPKAVASGPRGRSQAGGQPALQFHGRVGGEGGPSRHAAGERGVRGDAGLDVARANRRVALQPSASSSPAPSASASVPVSVSVPAAAGPVEPVDVLRQINPLRDSARGAWTFQGTTLASPRGEIGVLRLPVTPPAEYRLTMVVERLFSSPPGGRSSCSRRPIAVLPAERRPRHGDGDPVYRAAALPATCRSPTGNAPAAGESDDGLEIVLPVDGHPAALVLDGAQRTISGLELIDGKDVDQNGTAFHGEVLPRFTP